MRCCRKEGKNINQSDGVSQYVNLNSHLRPDSKLTVLLDCYNLNKLRAKLYAITC